MGSVFSCQNFRRKIFYDAYFRGWNSEMDFPPFLGKVTLEMLQFNFCCVSTIGFLQGHFFETKNFGKKFFHDAYFREVISARDFCLFLRGSLFEPIFWGKKFMKSSTFVF